jgi:hypothetical protein
MMIAILNLIINNTINAYKIVLFIGLICSGISMYFFVRKITDDKNVGILGAILYMSMPYHLNDMYIRNALGEFLSYVFIPLVFLGLYNLFNKEKKYWILIIGSLGLIITHNLMTAITAIIAIIYIGINLPKLKDKKIREHLIFSIIFIICISSFYWVPLLQTATTTNYEVYLPGMMATNTSVASEGLTLNRLIVTSNSERYVFELGPHILIMLCFTIAAFRRIEPKMKNEYIFFLIIGILATFMTTKYFPWKLFNNSIALIQFPWRLLVISNFCFALVCSINLGIVIKNFNFKDALILGTIAIVYVMALKSFIPLTDSDITQVENYENIGFVSGKAEDTLAGMGKSEYLPQNAYDNLFYVANREQGVLILEGSGEVYNVEKDGNKLTFSAESLENATVFELPYIYYPGYKITLDGTEICGYQDENGFLAISLNEISKSDITIEYTGTTLMKYSNVFSIISVILFAVYILAEKKIPLDDDNSLVK